MSISLLRNAEEAKVRQKLRDWREEADSCRKAGDEESLKIAERMIARYTEELNRRGLSAE